MINKIGSPEPITHKLEKRSKEGENIKLAKQQEFEWEEINKEEEDISNDARVDK